MRFKLYLLGWIIPPLFSCFLWQNKLCQASTIKAFFKSYSFAYSEPVTIKAIFCDDGKGRFSKGERAFAWEWFEVGFNRQDMGFSFIQRYDYDLRFSHDTAELFGLTLNKEDLPTGREFFLDLKADIFHAKGFRFNYNFSWRDRLKLVTGLSYLQADYLINGKAHGKAKVVAENDYDYAVEIKYQYTKDIVFDRSVNKPEGSGFSIDIDAEFQITPKWSAQLEVTDLLGRIYWKNLPLTDAIGTSDRKEYDSDGYIHINPALTGREGKHANYTQSLRPRNKLSTNYSYLNYSAVFEGYYQYDFFLWAMGGIMNSNSGDLMVKYWPENKALTIGYKKNTFEFELTADHFETDKVKMFHLLISCGF